MKPFWRNNGMSCKKATRLMGLYMADDPGLTESQRQRFEAHLAVCPACQKDYKDNKAFIETISEYWGPVSEGTRKLMEKAGYPVQERKVSLPGCEHPMTIEESIAEINRRIDENEERQRRIWQQRIRCFRRIGTATVAAVSIVIAVVVGWNTLLSPHDISEKTSIRGPP